MPLTYHPEFYAVIEPMLPAMAATPKAPRHDIETRRSRIKAIFEPLFSVAVPDSPDITRTIHTTKSYDGYEVSITQYTNDSVTPGPAVLHIHGGGLIAGDVPLFDRVIAHNVSQTKIPHFSVEYRLAPEHRFPAAVEDCYASLVWLQTSAAALNIDPSRIAVWGESAGGGLAAALAILARDRAVSPPIKKQILIYPMLDDRNIVPNPALEPLATWNTEDNITGWSAYLGADISTRTPDASSSVSPYAAAARVPSVVGLPPTYIEVGTLDLFRDEDTLYATRLLQADVDVEFHLYNGMPHAFEALAPETTPAKKALANRLDALVGV